VPKALTTTVPARPSLRSLQLPLEFTIKFCSAIYQPSSCGLGLLEGNPTVVPTIIFFAVEKRSVDPTGT